jgi:hypothetical protein
MMQALIKINKSLFFEDKNMKNKIIFCLFSIFLILLIACKKTDYQDVTKLENPEIVNKIISNFYIFQDQSPVKIASDTILRTYNTQKKLIKEQNMYWKYKNDTLQEQFLCLDKQCKEVYRWQYNYSKGLLNTINYYPNYHLNPEIVYIWKTFQYDPDGKLKMEVFHQNSNLAKDTISKKYFFAKNSKLEKVENHFFVESSAVLGKITVLYQYDSLKRVQQEIRFVGNDSTRTQQKKFLYNEKNQVLLEISSLWMPLNHDIEHYIDLQKMFCYDAKGRKTLVSTYVGSQLNYPYSQTEYQYK